MFIDQLIILYGDYSLNIQRNCQINCSVIAISHSSAKVEMCCHFISNTHTHTHTGAAWGCRLCAKTQSGAVRSFVHAPSLACFSCLTMNTYCCINIMSKGRPLHCSMANIIQQKSEKLVLNWAWKSIIGLLNANDVLIFRVLTFRRVSRSTG